MKKMLKNKELLIYILISIVVFLVCIFDLKEKLSLREVNNTNYYLMFTLVYLLLSLFIVIIRKRINKIIKNIPLLFVILSFTLGLIYLFFAPLFSGSDENTHFYRIYEISEGNILTDVNNNFIGSNLPESLINIYETSGGSSDQIRYGDILHIYNTPLNKSNRVKYGSTWQRWYSNTALYAPVQYIPQVIGVFIGRILNLPPFIIGNIGRLFNLLFYSIIGYYALRLIPKHKLFYLMILLCPNMLQCATTLGADAFTNIIFLLFISLILNIKYKEIKLNIKYKLLLAILSILLSVCKLVYFPVLLCLLLLNKKHFNSSKDNYIYKTIIILISLFLSLYWLSKTGYIFDITYYNEALQKKFIFSNIFEYIAIFIRTYLKYFFVYIEELFIGSRMYHSTLIIPSVFSYSYVIITILSLFKERIKNILSNKERILIFIISILILGLVSTALYLQCTAQFYQVGNNLIEGIQGRYFIPIIFLIPLIFNFKNIIKLKDETFINIIVFSSYIVFIYIFIRFVI